MDKKEEIKKDEIFFFHGRIYGDNNHCKSNSHRFTIAGKYKDIEGGRCLKLGASICNPTDQFRKSEGRKQATERLNNPTGLGNVEVCMRFPEGKEVHYFNMLAASFQGLDLRDFTTLFGFKELKEEEKKNSVE